MPRRRISHLFAALLILTMATLATFGTAAPARAATPSLSLDPNFLYLNVEPDSTAEATFNVTVGADQVLSASTNVGWLTVDQSVWQGSRTVRITATSRGMAPGQFWVGRIHFAGYPTHMDLPVVLAVSGPSDPPLMAVSHAGINFGTLPVGQSATYFLSLALATPADIRLTADADWIQGGPIAVDGATTTVIGVRPVLEKITAPGRYTATIHVQAGEYSLGVPVVLQVASPEAPPTGTAPDAQEGPFKDVPGTHWARGAIAELAAKQVINGVGDGRFAPDDTVTREQFAKLLALTFGFSHDPEPTPYPDVPIARWSAGYVVAAAPFMGRSPDGLFHPENPATREEIAVALTKVKGLGAMREPDLQRWFTDYADITSTAQPWVANARAVGLIGGFPDRTFRPKAPVTRAQVAVLLQRALAICGRAPEPGCAAPLGAADQSLAGVALKGPRDVTEIALGAPVGELSGYTNDYTRFYRNGRVQVLYVTPSQKVWSVRLQGAGATPRGIKIGDSLEAVRKAYGPQGELKDGVLTYRAGAESGYFTLQFFLVEGKVHTIVLSQSN